MIIEFPSSNQYLKFRILNNHKKTDLKKIIFSQKGIKLLRIKISKVKQFGIKSTLNCPVSVSVELIQQVITTKSPVDHLNKFAK